MSITNVNNNYFSTYNKAAVSNTVPQAAPPLSRDDKSEANPAVIVTLSDEAKAGAAETKKTFTEEMDEMKAESKSMRDQIEDARKQGEGVAESFEIHRKCMIIAMRIMNGDKVPMGDHRFLLKNDPELYGKAITLKRYKDDPEEHKRISKDKDDSPEASGASEASIPTSADAGGEIQVEVSDIE